MNRVRAISGLIAALAVLVVSATCTPAACLLPMGGSHQAQPKAVKSCCEESEQPAQPTHRVPQDERCPMCQNSVLLGTNVDHGPSFDAAALAVTFFIPVAQLPALSPTAAVVGNVSDCPPALCPASLLALHCALLT